MKRSLRTAQLTLTAVFLCVLGLLLFVGDLGAYETYRDPNQNGGMGYCAQCHEVPTGTGFVNKAVLHSSHTTLATGTCKLCHTSPGDIPSTFSSGVTDSLGCSGCHGQQMPTGFLGAGLRRHHALADAPPDNNGQRCADCHAGDPTPLAENSMPPYYLRDDVTQKDPCNADDTEDFWGPAFGPDGIGLDNDGDLLYDANDPDCAPPTCVDQDGDGYGDPGDPSCQNGEARDCDDTQNDTYPGAMEWFDGRDNNCNSLVDEVEGVMFDDAQNPMRLTWITQPPAGQMYDIIRSDVPMFPSASENSICLMIATPMAFTDDAEMAPAGSAFFYLVRNTQGSDYGMMSDGTMRIHPLCP